MEEIKQETGEKSEEKAWHPACRKNVWKLNPNQRLKILQKIQDDLALLVKRGKGVNLYQLLAMQGLPRQYWSKWKEQFNKSIDDGDGDSELSLLALGIIDYVETCIQGNTIDLGYQGKINSRVAVFIISNYPDFKESNDLSSKIVINTDSTTLGALSKAGGDI